MKFKKTLATILLAGSALFTGNNAIAEQIPFSEPVTPRYREITDDWEVGGSRRGWNPDNPSDNGAWDYMQTAHEDHLELRVNGPRTGGSYGAESWVRTTKDFNDGNEWMINFSWQAETDDSHFNHYSIQITDGDIPYADNLHWSSREHPGTKHLIRGEDVGFENFRGLLVSSTGEWPDQIADWSVSLDSSGTAKLFDGYNGSGNLIREEDLDKDSPWHMRFMVNDGTSAGFPGSDISMNLYNFEINQTPEPSTLLLGLAGLAGLGAYGLRRKF